jgi:hypothetical protein
VAIGLNVCVYLAQLAEYILFFIEVEDYYSPFDIQKTRTIIATLVMGSFSLLLGIGFIIFGSRIAQMFKQIPMMAQGTKTLWLVAGFCTFSFLFRGILLIVQYWVTLNWLFEFLYIAPR